MFLGLPFYYISHVLYMEGGRAWKVRKEGRAGFVKQVNGQKFPKIADAWKERAPKSGLVSCFSSSLHTLLLLSKGPQFDDVL